MWSEKENRRKFFDDFAQRHNFDPLVADNWHKFGLADFNEDVRINTFLRSFNYVAH
jgi:hypothetical protein